MALRRPYIIDDLQYLQAPTGGWNPDGNPWEIPDNQAPVLDNAVQRPGRVAVRGALTNWADLSAITLPAPPLNVCGVQPVPGATSLLIGRKAVSATAFVDPWFAPIVRPATSAALAAPTADAALVVGGTGLTNTARAANLIPGPRGITFEGTRLYIGYGTSTSPVADTAGTYFAQSTNVVALSSAGVPTAYTNAPRGAVDIKGYQSRIWLLGGIDDPAATNTFNPLTLFYSIPLAPGGGNTASFADWKDPVTGFTNKITMDGDTTDPGVGLATVRNGLVIFRAASIWLLRGSTPSSYSLVPVSRQVGCVDPRSIVETDRGVYFMSKQGLMLTDGVSVVNVSTVAAVNTLQAAVALVNGSIHSSFGGYITSTVTNGGQIVVSMGVPSITSSAPDGHIQPVWCGMFDPSVQAWTRITSALFASDGNIVQTGNNYPGWVFSTPDRRMLSIGDKYITQWEAETASTNLVSFSNVNPPATATNDATVGGTQAWTNPANVELGGDGNYASSAISNGQSSIFGPPGTLSNDASNGGTIAWSNLGGNIFGAGPVANGATTKWGVFTNFSFPTIPSNAVILGAFIQIGVRDNATGNLAVGGVKLVKGGSIVGNDHSGDQPLTVNGGNKRWGQGVGLSNWGVSLTPADINSSGFGFALYGTGPGPIGGDTIKLDFNAINFSVIYAIPTNYLKASNFGFSLAAGATVTGIQAKYSRQVSNFDGIDLEVKLMKAGTIQATNRAPTIGDPVAITSYWTGRPDVGLSTDTYGGAADLWGTTWTAADINNSGFGIALSTGILGFGTQADIDSVTLTVYYTLSGVTKQQSFTQQPALYDTDAAGNFQPIPFRWRTRLVPVIGTNSSTRKIVQLRRWVADYAFQGLALPSANGFTAKPVDASGALVAGAAAVPLPPVNNSMTGSSISGGPSLAAIIIERLSTDLFSTVSDVAFDITWTDAQQSTSPSAVVAELYGIGLAYLPSSDLR